MVPVLYIPLLDSSPYFPICGEMGKCCQNEGARIWRVVVIKQLNIRKPENTFSHEG